MLPWLYISIKYSLFKMTFVYVYALIVLFAYIMYTVLIENAVELNFSWGFIFSACNIRSIQLILIIKL